MAGRGMSGGGAGPGGQRDQLLDHDDLLTCADAPDLGGRRPDAIIVPSARPASSLLHAAGLAEELNTPLLVLASRQAHAAEIVREIEDHGIVADVVAIDVTGAPRLMPGLETAGLFTRGPFGRTTDVSMKRNLALLLSRAAGWDQVMFLDDDIQVPDAADLRRAAALLPTHAAVGLHIDGMPDNSVVCHARRELGDRQGTFVGGGALLVPVERSDGAFFPHIYNEDWFFLLDEGGIRPVARTGRAVQQWYDPFVNPDRARGEELGDTLAEGVFAALSHGKLEDALKPDYWVGFLEVRRRLITRLLQRAAGRESMVTALKAARGRSYLIEPHLCARFLKAWERDQNVWRRAVEALSTGRGIAGAISHFGLRRSATVRLNRTGPAPREPRLRQHRKHLDALDQARARELVVTGR
ncbi:hypothetical protein Dvina_50245 [Dactylosporangium vinaceum]|uniref:Glycosyltransferase n=1 Tax=Dactylosporangium vinaceum TaxID=53362 RepID=A0ABV5M4W0_9ACTN|nr:hypothetical protein [Dactylosporangium vinaceum]UAB96049.1 hypothetical protein Dvina_50245 [Dactylosporangium vinaceum]